MDDDHGYSSCYNVQFLGSPPRQIDDAPADKRTAIGYPDYHTLSVCRVVYTQHGAEWVSAVCTCQAIVMQTFAIGGAYSVDKFYRLANDWGWWPDEQPDEATKLRTERQLFGILIMIGRTG